MPARRKANPSKAALRMRALRARRKAGQIEHSPNVLERSANVPPIEQTANVPPNESERSVANQAAPRAGGKQPLTVRQSVLIDAHRALELARTHLDSAVDNSLRLNPEYKRSESPVTHAKPRPKASDDDLPQPPPSEPSTAPPEAPEELQELEELEELEPLEEVPP